MQSDSFDCTELKLESLLKDSETTDNSNNIQFLVDQIKEAKSAIDKGKLAAVPEKVVGDAGRDLAEFASIIQK